MPFLFQEVLLNWVKTELSFSLSCFKGGKKKKTVLCKKEKRMHLSPRLNHIHFLLDVFNLFVHWL